MPIGTRRRCWYYPSSNRSTSQALLRGLAEVFHERNGGAVHHARVGADAPGCRHSGSLSAT